MRVTRLYLRSLQLKKKKWEFTGNSLAVSGYDSALSLLWPQVQSLVGLPQWLSSKEFTCNAGDTGDAGLILGSGRSPGGEMATHSSIFAWKTYRDRSLPGYGPWGLEESNAIEWLNVHKGNKVLQAMQWDQQQQKVYNQLGKQLTRK